MEPSLNVMKLIRDREDFRAVSYRPTPKDVWTIGFGHTGPDVTQKGVVIYDIFYSRISMDQAETLLWHDCDVMSKQLARLIRKGVRFPNQDMYDAVFDLFYNIGSGNFGSSTMLKNINNSDWIACEREFPRWNRQCGVILGGLVERRQMELDLFEKGENDAGIKTA